MSEKIEGAPKNGQSRETGNTGHPTMGNPEKPVTLGTHEWAIQRNRQHWAPNNGQSRETGNTGHPRMGNPEKRQHWVPKNGQSRETGNTWHPTMGNPEKPATLDTQDT